MSKTSIKYHRQELVLGKKAQDRLQKSNVAILGVGALGSNSAELLARAGVNLTIIDRDVVDQTNLHRQMLYSEGDIGKAKSVAAAERLSKINSDVKITSIVADLDKNNIEKLMGKSDLILDCSDNLYVRFLINDYAKKFGKMWIYAGVIMDHGAVMVVTKDSPCFRCVFSEAQTKDTCDTVGVLNTASSAISAIQVNEAIKVLTGTITHQELIHFNINTLKLFNAKTKHSPKCPVCKGAYEYLEGSSDGMLNYSCSGMYHFKFDKIDLIDLKDKLSKIGPVNGTKDYLFFQNIGVFRSGEVLVKAKSNVEAKQAISKYIGM